MTLKKELKKEVSDGNNFIFLRQLIVGSDIGNKKAFPGVGKLFRFDRKEIWSYLRKQMATLRIG
jgi:hypothetical protein